MEADAADLSSLSPPTPAGLSSASPPSPVWLMQSLLQTQAARDVAQETGPNADKLNAKVMETADQVAKNAVPVARDLEKDLRFQAKDAERNAGDVGNLVRCPSLLMAVSVLPESPFCMMCAFTVLWPACRQIRGPKGSLLPVKAGRAVEMVNGPCDPLTWKLLAYYCRLKSGMSPCIAAVRQTALCLCPAAHEHGHCMLTMQNVTCHDRLKSRDMMRPSR